LLSVLGSFAIQTKPPKTAALASPVLEITATIEELANQATKKHPHIEERKPVAKSSDADSTVSKPLQPDSESAPVPDLTASAKPFTSSTVSSDTFDWDALIQHARTNYVALFSVLSKCSYELLEDELTLFTVNAFYKKKLDDPKYSSHLYDCLKAIGGFQLSIHTIPTRAPLKDVQAASIADIMGGGIEVSLS
ncbi:MAG: dnaX, partial [Candidatus Saccharibacteria bacterium]|nr:dnaX [Candidatus Saccharibacteria bacterium]